MRWWMDIFCGLFVRMLRPALVLAVVVVAASVGKEAVSAEEIMSRQRSSHQVEFFRELLTERVWVYEQVSINSPLYRDYASAAYFHKDGRVTVCTSWESGGYDFSGHWAVVPSAGFTALYAYTAPGEVYDTSQRRGHMPIFYDAETGRFHSESPVSEGIDTWYVFLRGWVQESWPAALVDACPGLSPAGVPVNEKQGSVVFSKLMSEDPKAPLRHFPGSERAIPGARGLAATGHQPTYPAEELRAWLAANNGMLVQAGKLRYVLALGPRGDEVWLLKKDSDEVVDTIVLTPSEDGNGVILQYEKRRARLLYRLGYPLGILSTGERYGAMALMDRLVESGESVALPFMNRESVGFRFLADGGLRVGTLSGAEIGGEWWWSKGMLHLQVEGIDAVNTFEWRALASHVGWSE